MDPWQTLRKTSRPRTGLICRWKVAAVGLTSLAVMSAACGPPVGTDPIVTPGATVPAIPLPAATSYTISPAAINEVPCTACVRGESPNAAQYFYGELPLGSVDHQLRGVTAEPRKSVGNMFVSGYFGGIYLRAALGGGSAEGAAASTPIRGLLDVIGTTTAAGIDSIAGSLLDTAERGTDAEVRSASAAWAALLAAIYGYNRGYLDVALQHPPAGSGIAASTLACTQYFECRSPGLRLPALDTLNTPRNALVFPTSLEWLFATNALTQIVGATVPAGQQVWTQILAGSSFDAASYRRIVDLSFGFLEVTEGAMLANLGGAAGGDIAMARRGLVSTASMVVWAGSYFLGLASPLGNGVQPTIACPA